MALGHVQAHPPGAQGAQTGSLLGQVQGMVGLQGPDTDMSAPSQAFISSISNTVLAWACPASSRLEAHAGGTHLSSPCPMGAHRPLHGPPASPPLHLTDADTLGQVRGWLSPLNTPDCSSILWDHFTLPFPFQSPPTFPGRQGWGRLTQRGPAVPRPLEAAGGQCQDGQPRFLTEQAGRAPGPAMLSPTGPAPPGGSHCGDWVSGLSGAGQGREGQEGRRRARGLPPPPAACTHRGRGASNNYWKGKSCCFLVG